MYHHPLSRHTGHYAVNYNTNIDGILVQLMHDDFCEQVRVVMTPEEVDHFIELLQRTKTVVKLHNNTVP